jgi:hypothetical protein
MRYVARLFAGLMALLLSIGSSGSAQSSDEEVLRKLQGDPGTYTDDSFFFSGAHDRLIVGKEPPPPSRGGARTNFRQVDDIQKLHISRSRDVAYAYGTPTLSWDGQKPFQAAFLRGYRKEEGRWKVAALFQRPIGRD